MITVNGRNALVEAADEPWVTTALGKIAAAPKPSTQPATFLQRLSANRESIIRQMMTDLSTNDPVPLAKGYDTELTPAMRTLDELHPPIFYLVTTPDRLAALMKAGWQDPRFYYNRAADSVSFSLAGALTTDRPMDDVAVPTMYDAKDSADKHAESLTLQITGFEAQIAQQVDLRAARGAGDELCTTRQQGRFRAAQGKGGPVVVRHRLGEHSVGEIFRDHQRRRPQAVGRVADFRASANAVENVWRSICCIQRSLRRCGRR